jgi:hypothetical protein
MNYPSLVRDAWAITWRTRFLWILGLFAGVTGSSLSFGRSSLPSNLAIEQAQAWIVAAVVVGVLLAVLSVVARGGITQATVDIQHGQPSSLLSAWRAGARWFWRFLGLLVLLGALAGAVLGAVVLAVANLGAAGAVLGAVLLTVGAAASIVLAYAERAIVIHDFSVRASLEHGWQLFSQHLSASLLAWIVSIGLVAALGALGSASVASLLSAQNLVDVLTGAAVLALIVAIGNAFLWSYWTLAYLRLDTSSVA